MNLRKQTFLVLPLLILLGFEPAEGQIWVGPTDTKINPRWAAKDDFDGSSLVFCRGYYELASHREGVWGWYVDYPGADHNFLVRIAELTKTRIRRDKDGKPVHVVVRLDSPLIFNCPVVFLADPGVMGLKEGEIANLRLYLEKGGFIWADDFWGFAEWDNWVRQIRQVLPSGLYPMFDIPNDHPIMNQVYYVEKIPQISNFRFWYNNKEQTSEQGEESKEVHFVGINDKNGRLIVVVTHNTDIADPWEREGFDTTGKYFFKFSSTAYAIGINIFIYALSH